jgi:hypothetical protein
MALQVVLKLKEALADWPGLSWPTLTVRLDGEKPEGMLSVTMTLVAVSESVLVMYRV